MKVMLTGCFGFIGFNFLRSVQQNFPDDFEIVGIDNLNNKYSKINSSNYQNKNFTFIELDINNINEIDNKTINNADLIINFAAESHVDRSISNPLEFVETNVLGTVNLLNSFKRIWQGNYEGKRFYHVSTDEVYGSLGESGLFTEKSPYDPRSPYSASKASSDHFVRAYGETYGLPYVLSNCSNNYGEYHFPEKLIPLFINNILNNKPLPVYGDGNFTRDWLYVKDHARAIDLIFHQGINHQTYNIGGFNEWKNIDLVRLLCSQMDEKLGREKGSSEKLITFVKDRPGHDKRYAIDATKINTELGWSPSVTFEEGLSNTIDWYLSNSKWLENVTSGAYAEYYKKQYQ